MGTPLFNSTTIPILEQVIGFAQSRHTLLAGNIANLDTPGYQVRDLSVESFQEALKEVIEAKEKTGQPISPGLMSSGPDEAMRHVKDSMKSILYHDGSDVGLEQQVTEIAKNQMMHDMAIDILAAQFRLLQTAISEKV